MPISRRDKNVSLTKVKKKPNKKITHIAKIRALINEFSRVYVVKLHNPRNNKISELRKNATNLKLIFGKNKLTQIALGKNENMPKLHKLCNFIKGQCALLLSNTLPNELREELDSFRSQEFPRPGILAEQTLNIAEGPFPKFTRTMEPILRKLGLPVKLIRGVVHVQTEYRVCNRGDILTPEQCRLLKLFEIEMAEFRVGLIATWTAEDGVEELEEHDSYTMRTSLVPEVLVVCKQLDDGQFYFIQEPIKLTNNGEAMETDEKIYNDL